MPDNDGMQTAHETSSGTGESIGEQGELSTTIALAWADVADLVAGIAGRVIADGMPDVILGIQRGGLVPSVILSHLLGVRALVSFNIRCTVHDGIRAPKIRPVPGPNIPFDTLAGKDILVVDDIAGSGRTLDVVRRTLSDWQPTRLRTLVCVVNRANWDAVQNTLPQESITYVGTEVRSWVVFPWEGHAT